MRRVRWRAIGPLWRVGESVLFVLGQVNFLESLREGASRRPDSVENVVNATTDDDTDPPTEGVDSGCRDGHFGGRADGSNEARHVGCDTTDVGDDGSRVASFPVPVPSLVAVGEEIGHSVVALSHEVVIADHDTRYRG